MDKIIMKNMKFFAYHGVLPEERNSGQDFLIDAELYLDLRKSGCSDELEDTADYSAVYAVINNVVKNNKFRLIEKLADSIAREILSKYKIIKEVAVEVRKPDAPIKDAQLAGGFDYISVVIKRSADEL